MEVILNEDTPAEVLQELVLKEKSAMALCVYNLYNVDIHSETMPPQYEKSKSILRAIAKNPNTAPDTFKELFECCPVEVLNNISFSLLILENPCLLEELYICYNNYEVFGMDNIPLFFEEWGANHNDVSIRQSAAIKIKTPSLLEKCSNDDNLNVRKCVASNENTPCCILEKLSLDKYAKVRQATAYNPNTPKNILLKLAQDKNLTVRINVAANISTPQDILELLAQNKSRDIRQQIASNPNVSVKILEFLARDKCEVVLTQVAFNEKTPPHILKILATKDSYLIIQAIAANPQTPHDVLELVKKSDYYYVDDIPF